MRKLWQLSLQDVFDLPFRMGRDQIEESLRTKMASIKVIFFDINFHFIILWVMWWYFFFFWLILLKFKGAVGSVTRCTERGRSYFWSNWERAWTRSSTCWGKKHNSRAGTWLLYSIWVKFFVGWMNCIANPDLEKEKWLLLVHEQRTIAL